ncbi:hypothetical protein [Sulfitobacter mediterraneus]|jgi:argininosuccinate lyase|nr:hypothetical protein [Sulfitobacter mediterraneus]KIN76514.1 hypothetical protein Z950_1336 [Sulfitobacter mediterraneus KCTC 32188]
MEIPFELARLTYERSRAGSIAAMTHFQRAFPWHFGGFPAYLRRILVNES